MKLKKLLIVLSIVFCSMLVCCVCNNVNAMSAAEMKNKFEDIRINGGDLSDGAYFTGSYRDVAWTCYGFANAVAERVFGSSHYTNSSEWTWSNNLNDLCVGDVVEYYEPGSSSGKHCFIVTNIRGTDIEVTDSNWYGNCQNHWYKGWTNHYDLTKPNYGIHAVWHHTGSNIKTLDNIPLEAPKNIKATNNVGTKVKATWDAVNGASKYLAVVYYASDVKNSYFGNRVAQYETTGTSYTFDLPKGDYYVYVHSYNGEWSQTGGNGAAVSVNPITSFSLNKTSLTLNKGSKATLTATITPSNTTNSKGITWTSSNKNVATVSLLGVVRGVSAGTATITAKTSNGLTKKCTVTVTDESGVQYRAYVQGKNWQSYMNDGQQAGTTGSALRLEAIQIGLTGAQYSGSIQYRTHIQNEGWESTWKSNGATSGTVGKNLRLEAIQIKLTGTISNYYDVYYRVHAQNYGWLGWAKNGESAGTEGFGYRVESVQIKLVKKGASAPGSTANAYVKSNPSAALSYATHVQNIGWQGYVKNGALSGTTGKGLRIEGLKVLANNFLLGNIKGGVQYSTHVQNIGWTKNSADGAVSGTVGKGLRTEAVKISFTGNLAANYDIYYRVYVQNLGWLGWAKNGAPAGTQGYGYRLEGIQVKVVRKGGAAPGSTASTFIKK